MSSLFDRHWHAFSPLEKRVIWDILTIGDLPSDVARREGVGTNRIAMAWESVEEKAEALVQQERAAITAPSTRRHIYE